MLFLQIDIDLIERQVILHPFKALARRFQLCEIVEPLRLRAHDRRNHGGSIHNAFVDHGGDPAACAAIDMRIAQCGGAGPHADEGSVPAAAEHGGARFQAEFRSRFFRDFPDLVGGLLDRRKVIHVYAEHIAHLPAPSLLALADIIDQGGKGGILRHNKFTRHFADEEFLHIQPLMYALKILRLVRLHPLVFPHRVFHARRNRAGNLQAFEQLKYICARDLRAMGQALFQLLPCTLVHIAHRAAHRLPVLIHKDDSLHLGAEGNATDPRRVHAGSVQHLPRARAHSFPPFGGFLFRAAIRQHIELIPTHGRRRQTDNLADLEQAGFYASGAHVVSDNIGRFFHAKPSKNMIPVHTQSLLLRGFPAAFIHAGQALPAPGPL